MEVKTNKRVLNYLTPEQEEKLRVTVGILRMYRQKSKAMEVQKFRPTSNKLKKIKLNKNCCICGESRCVEFCHIVPVSVLKQLPKKVANKFKIEDNLVFLCKNHHWCFDHFKLDKNELECIYQNKKDFIKGELKDLANMRILPNPKAKVTERDKAIVKRFDKWVEWVATVFYTKN